jgi:hypothetical protein
MMEEAIILILLLFPSIYIIWHWKFIYSPDKRYRMNKYTGVIEEETIIETECPEDGPLSTLSEIGVAIDKQYVLNMWRQGLSMEIESNLRVIDADFKRSCY